MVMEVAVEIDGVTESTVAGAVGGCTPTTSNLHPGDWRVAKGAGAYSGIAVYRDDNVAGMAARAGRDAGDSTVILDQMVFVIAGIGGVTVCTCR